MEIDLFELYTGNAILMLFTLIGIGLLVGKIQIGPIELGSTTGVLLVGLLFGHFGLTADASIGSIGFAIFIFAVGLQAGPSFFSVFLTDGVKYITLALFIAVISFSCAFGISKVLGLDYGLSAGLLAGSLTSTPTLAGAQDAITSGLANIPEGMTAEMANQNISVAYAITYLFGTVGLIIVIRYFPVLLKVDLPQEAKSLTAKFGFDKKNSLSSKAEKIPVIRAYAAPSKSVGQTVKQTQGDKHNGIVALRIRRKGKIIEAKEDDIIEAGDVISIIGALQDHETHRETLGQEFYDPELLNFDISTKEIVVIDPKTAGKSLAELTVIDDNGCFIRGIKRASIQLGITPDIKLAKGDRIYLTGENSRLNKVAEIIGRIEAEDTQTDLLSFSIGIAVGSLLGMLMVKLGNVSIGLGSAGGLLLMGITIGYVRSMRPTFGGVPPAALKILMEVGLTLFMAGVGLRAGAGIVEGFKSAGLPLLLGGVCVTLTPLIFGYFFGRKVLKMNPALLLGAITGGMTSTPALNVVNEAAKSEAPALGYAGTYTFANVLLTFAGTIMMTL
jgi:putative transport protein